MIHGYHVILPMYGFWLPNDPRGSWSDFVRKWELVRFGAATKTVERRSLTELSGETRRVLEVDRSRALNIPLIIGHGSGGFDELTRIDL